MCRPTIVIYGCAHLHVHTVVCLAGLPRVGEANDRGQRVAAQRVVLMPAHVACNVRREGRAIPCNVRRERGKSLVMLEGKGGQSRVMLEGKGGQSLVTLESKEGNPFVMLEGKEENPL